MFTKLIPLLVLFIVSSGSFSTAVEVPAKIDYAVAEKVAVAKRQEANQAKAKVDDMVANQQKPAEAKLAAMTQAVTDATNAKAAPDKALSEANAALTQAQQACSTAEKIAQDAEAVAKAKAEAAGKLGDETSKATDAAKAGLIQAQQKQQEAQNQANTAAQKLTEAAAQKTTADDILVKVKTQVAAAVTASDTAEKTAQDAEAKKKQATDDATAKRKTAVDAEAVLAKAREGAHLTRKRAAVIEKMPTEAEAHRKIVDQGMADAERQVAAAVAVSEAAGKAAQESEASRQQAESEAASKCAAADEAKATLAQARQSEQQAQAQASAATQKLTEAETQKKAADEGLANAKNQVAAAVKANQAAEEAVKNFMRVEQESQQMTADAGAKRKAADAAKAVQVQAQQKQQEAQNQANTAAQKLTEAAAQKKSAEESLANIKNQVAAATQVCEAAEKAALAAEDAADPAKGHKRAEDAAKAAEAAVGPLKDIMQKADTTYAEASKVATQKRQYATDTKNLSGESGVKELERAEANLADAMKGLTDAMNAKPPLDKALEEAKAAARPLQEAFDAADKEAKEAEAAAKIATDAANKLDNEGKKAANQATAMRRTADTAKAALDRARQNEQNLQKQLAAAGAAIAEAEKSAQSPAAAKTLARATAQKKLAETQLAGVKKQIDAAAAASDAAEQAAQAAAKTAEEKKQVADAAAAKRKAAADAAAVLIKAQQDEQQAQAQVTAAAQKVTESQAQKKPADDALANIKSQVAAAVTASEAAEKSAQEAAARAKQISEDAAKPEAEKKQANDDAGTKRKAADDAKAALAKVQQSEQQAQAQVTAAAQKVTEAEAQKKTADDALANARNQVATATAANQAASEAAKEIIQLDTASREASALAGAKRKVANDAKAVLDPKAKTLEQAAVQANTAAGNLDRAETRKKASEDGLENLKKRIASAKQTNVADEQVAKEAEAAAAPLKVDAEKTRAAYVAAKNMADDMRAAAQDAKAVLYRLLAAKQVSGIMESPEQPKSANRIDEIIFAKLKSLGIQPALCSDSVFIRRAYLDLTGKLPSGEEAREFIQSSDQNKRIALIDRLLEESAHADYWAMKWSDILRVKAEYPVKVWPNAAQAYYRWIWESIAHNKPYDQFARELLTSSGSNYRVGAVNFYRAIQDKTSETIAVSVGMALMGTRVQFWPEDRRKAMMVFFSQVGYKPTSEWKEEIVFWDPLHSTVVSGSIAVGIDAVAKSVKASNLIPQGLEKPMSENGPLEAVFPDGTKTTIPPDRDPREVFADWLIRPENPWFVKAIVNRTWAWAMGRGIINEADDIRDNNPPSNPELLAYLEKELVSSGYDLKKLKRLIFTSTAYQFSSIPKYKVPEARANFASYSLRRVEAEVMIDALNEITGSSDLYTSAVPEPFTYIPKDMSAVALADGSVTSSFLMLFGRSARATGMENERVNELDSTQWLYTLNSAAIQEKLQTGPHLRALLSAGGKPNEIAERLYLTILSRFPTDADVKALEGHSQTGVSRGNDAWVDLAWALINSPEFLLRH